MFSEPIVMRDAVIPSIHVKTQDGKLQTRILVTATLNTGLADDLHCRSLVFAENGAPKEGFSRLELSTGCGPFRAVFEADPALKQSFELLAGDSTDRYEVTRLAEGGLQLKLRLNYHGDPHQVIAYVQAIGTADSKLKIVPLQRELETAAEEPESKPEPVSIVSKEAVRQRLTPRTGRHKKVAASVQ